MECKSANDYMMKYMDETLTEDEASQLNAHLCACASCKDDFAIYEMLTTEFDKESTQLFEPPIDFEECVMKKICTIQPSYSKQCSQDAVLGFIFGAFSMLFGFGVVLFMFRDEIMSVASQNSYAAKIMESAAVISDKVIIFGTDISQKIIFYLNGANALIDSAKYVILAVVVVLVAAQFFVYSRNKVEV